jgi:hypothetical protein
MFKKLTLKIYEKRFRRYGRLVNDYLCRMKTCRENGDHDRWVRLCKQTYRISKKRSRVLDRILFLRGHKRLKDV